MDFAFSFVPYPLSVPPVSVQSVMSFLFRSFCSDPADSVNGLFTTDLWPAIRNSFHEVVIVIVEPLHPIQLRHDRSDDDADMFLI